MPESKMFDKKNLNEMDPSTIKDKITESEQGMAKLQADLTEEKKVGTQGNDGSTCSGKDPYMPKNPVKKESPK